MLEDYYTIEVLSVNPPPVNIGMFESLNCPICDIDLTDELGIDLRNFEVSDDTTIYCEGCDLTIKFKIKRI